MTHATTPNSCSSGSHTSSRLLVPRSPWSRVATKMAAATAAETTSAAIALAAVILAAGIALGARTRGRAAALPAPLEAAGLAKGQLPPLYPRGHLRRLPAAHRKMFRKLVGSQVRGCIN